MEISLELKIGGISFDTLNEIIALLPAGMEKKVSASPSSLADMVTEAEKDDGPEQLDIPDDMEMGAFPGEDEPQPVPKSISLIDCRDKLVQYSSIAGREKAMELLGKFNASKMSELVAADYPAFYAEVERALS